MIDSHCHLADEAFAADLGDVASRAMAAGVESAMCILSADEPAEIARVPAVRAAWPAIRFAAGVHPHRAGEYAGRAHEAVAAAREAVAAAQAVALGEIGLDYHYDFSPRDVQRAVFEGQVALALELDLPVVIHAREAGEDTHVVLRAAGPRLRGVMHCFSGTPDEAEQFLALGFYVSFAGMLTFPKAQNVRDLAGVVPIDRVLLETDAPFLAPVPHRGKRNEPAWVMRTLDQLAIVKQFAIQELDALVAGNFLTLIGAAR
jgi:TatD DNase family protein